MKINQSLLFEILFFTLMLFAGGILNTIQCFLKKGWGKVINVFQIIVFGSLIIFYPLSGYFGLLSKFKLAAMLSLVAMFVIELLEVSHVWHERKFYLSPKEENSDEPEKPEVKPGGILSRLNEKKEVRREEKEKTIDQELQRYNEKLFWSVFNSVFNSLLVLGSILIYVSVY